MNTAIGIIKGFINLLYPRTCASCAKSLESADERGVCDACLAKIGPNPEPYCRSCGRSTQSHEDRCRECRKMRPFFASAHSACLHEGPLKDLIHKFKYKNGRSLSGVFTTIMLDFIRDNPGVIEGVEIITFVPLHRKRTGERGYNQSELLARGIGKELGIPVTGCLEKTRLTRNQNELSRQERLVNVRGAFSIKSGAKTSSLKGRNILIIDDVMTTGATLNEVSRTLMDAGAEIVRCLTLARGI